MLFHKQKLVVVVRTTRSTRRQSDKHAVDERERA